MKELVGAWFEQEDKKLLRKVCEGRRESPNSFLLRGLPQLLLPCDDLIDGSPKQERGQDDRGVHDEAADRPKHDFATHLTEVRSHPPEKQRSAGDLAHARS